MVKGTQWPRPSGWLCSGFGLGLWVKEKSQIKPDDEKGGALFAILRG